MKNDLWHLHAVFLLILFFLIPANIYPQYLSELDLAKIDTLLLQGNKSLLQRFFKEKETEISQLKIADPDTNEFHFIRDRSTKLSDYFQQLRTYSDTELDQRVEKFREFKDGFTSLLAGKKSAEYYMEFLSYSFVKKIKAIKYYHLAILYKKLFVENTMVIINQKFNQVDQYYNQGEFEKAKTILQNIEIEFKLFLKQKDMRAKYDIFGEKIDKELKNIKINEKLYGQDYNTNFSFLISIGGQFIPLNSNVTENQVWYFISNTRNYIYDYRIEKIELISSYGFFTDIAYYVRPDLKISLMGQYGKNNSNSYNERFLYKSSFNITYYSIQIMTDYLFTQKTGLRPYIGMGLKKLFLTREKIINNNDFIVLYNLISEKQQSTVTQALLQTGVEYVYDKNSNFVFQIYADLYHNMIQSKLIGDFGLNVGIKLGYAFNK